jgi:hypothetical protein
MRGRDPGVGFHLIAASGGVTAPVQNLSCCTADESVIDRTAHPLPD